MHFTKQYAMLLDYTIYSCPHEIAWKVSFLCNAPGVSAKFLILMSTKSGGGSMWNGAVVVGVLERGGKKYMVDDGDVFARCVFYLPNTKHARNDEDNDKTSDWRQFGLDWSARHSLPQLRLVCKCASTIGKLDKASRPLACPLCARLVGVEYIEWIGPIAIVVQLLKWIWRRSWLKNVLAYKGIAIV